LSNQRQIVFFGVMFVCSLCSTRGLGIRHRRGGFGECTRNRHRAVDATDGITHG